jgi:hypothetical protein
MSGPTEDTKAALDKIKQIGGTVDARFTKPQQKGRIGLKPLLTYHSPAVMRQLKIISAEQGKTVQGLVQEALNGLFETYRKPPIAD